MLNKTERLVSFTIDTSTFEGTPEQIITNISEIISIHQSPEYYSPRFDMEYYGYDGEVNFYLRFTRKETEKEKEKRLAIEAKATKDKQEKTAKAKAAELALLAKLKAKYGDNSN